MKPVLSLAVALSLMAGTASAQTVCGWDSAAKRIVVGGGAPYAVADGQPWYYSAEPIAFDGKRYVKYGLPRVYGDDEWKVLEKVGEHRGVMLLAEKGQSRNVLYVPNRLVCEVQPYQVEP